MPYYEFVCSAPDCRERMTPYYPISQGPPPNEWCQTCKSLAWRDYSAVQVVANPVVWREENRVTEPERAIIRQKAEEYEKKMEAVVPQKVTDIKPFASLHEAHQEAGRLLKQGGTPNGVADGRYVAISRAEAEKRGLA